MSVTNRNEPRSPYEQDDGVTQLQEDVLGLLEAADLPTDINDRIIELVREGETRRHEATLPPGATV